MIRELQIDLEGKQVKVYRNLNNGLWSVLFKVAGKEKVVAHLPSVNMLNVTFLVREGGRLRVLAQKRKGVHAYACGTFTAIDSQPMAAISYNPYTAGYFYQESDQSPVYTASHVRLCGTKAYATLSGLF